MKIKRIKKAICFILVMIVIASIFIIGINLFVEKSGDKLTYSMKAAKTLDNIDYIFVLGCKVWGDKPSPMLEDRLDTAIELYKSGVAKKILMSGDGRPQSLEVQTMKNYAIAHGIPEKAIYMDLEGYNTITSMRRAKDIYNIESMIVVTQGFHLSRSVYNASCQGIEVYGVASDLREYPNVSYNWKREIPARVKDFMLNLVD